MGQKRLDLLRRLGFRRGGTFDHSLAVFLDDVLGGEGRYCSTGPGPVIRRE
jgi:hypothetical protein